MEARGRRRMYAICAPVGAVFGRKSAEYLPIAFTSKDTVAVAPCAKARVTFAVVPVHVALADSTSSHVG